MMPARRSLAHLCLVLVTGCVNERIDGETAQSHERPAVAEPAADEPSRAAPELIEQVEPPPPPPPEPAPFAGREFVRVDELLAALSQEVDALATSATSAATTKNS